MTERQPREDRATSVPQQSIPFNSNQVLGSLLYAGYIVFEVLLSVFLVFFIYQRLVLTPDLLY